MRAYLRHLINPAIIASVVIFILVAIILLMIFTRKVKNFKQQYRSKFWIYLLSSLLIFAIFTFLGNSKSITTLPGEFIFYQVTFGILGIAHVLMYRYYFNKFEKEARWIEFLFNIIIMIFAVIPFTLVYTYINGNTYSLYMTTSLLMFMLPTWIYAVFNVAISIPAKIYKTWPFPALDAFPEPKEDEFKDLVVVTFVFDKRPDAPTRTEFRAKSPIRMDFGRLFFHFVNDYNDRNSDSPIQVTDETGAPQHWVFYLKPQWYGVSKYIDPDLPMYMNGVSENSIIICQRTNVQQVEDNATNQQRTSR